MADAKGFGVRVSIDCYDPSEDRWSATSNKWFGLKDEYTMNLMAAGCSEALLGFIKQANEAKYGNKPV